MIRTWRDRRVIHVASIRKTYGRTVAVDDVSFEVQPGRDLRPDRPERRRQDDDDGVRRRTAHARSRRRSRCSGSIPCRDAHALQERIGVQLQEAQLQKRIKVREAVDLWASLYRQTASTAIACSSSSAWATSATPGS